MDGNPFQRSRRVSLRACLAKLPKRVRRQSLFADNLDAQKLDDVGRGLGHIVGAAIDIVLKPADMKHARILRVLANLLRFIVFSEQNPSTVIKSDSHSETLRHGPLAVYSELPRSAQNPSMKIGLWRFAWLMFEIKRWRLSRAIDSTIALVLHDI